VSGIAGEDHARTFSVECRIAALDVVGSGRGTSRRAAEQAAAADAYAQLMSRAGDDRGA
jgi:ribonuclease-3